MVHDDVLAWIHFVMQSLSTLNH